MVLKKENTIYRQYLIHGSNTKDEQEWNANTRNKSQYHSSEKAKFHNDNTRLNQCGVFFFFRSLMA